MSLKSITKTFIVVDYNDLNEFIQEHTPFSNYDCVESEEWGNYSKHSFSIDGKLSDYEKRQWNSLHDVKRPRSWDHMLRVILNALCEQGIIPAGEYLISVSW